MCKWLVNICVSCAKQANKLGESSFSSSQNTRRVLVWLMAINCSLYLHSDTTPRRQGVRGGWGAALMMGVKRSEICGNYRKGLTRNSMCDVRCTLCTMCDLICQKRRRLAGCTQPLFPQTFCLVFCTNIWLAKLYYVLYYQGTSQKVPGPILLLTYISRTNYRITKAIFCLLSFHVIRWTFAGNYASKLGTSKVMISENLYWSC